MYEQPITAPAPRRPERVNPIVLAIDRAVSIVSPMAGLRRQQARAALRAFEAVRPGLQRKPREETRSPNASVGPAASKLRYQGRWYEENSDLGNGILAALVDNTVGTGIVTNPAIRTTDGKLAKALNKKVRALWRRWSNKPGHCDVAAQHTWAGIQRLAARTTFRDGEVFGQIVRGTNKGLPPDRIVPLSLEMLEADTVPIALNEPDNRIVQGVRVNDWNRPISYFVHKVHPGSTLNEGALIGMSAINSKSKDLKEIDAPDALHCKLANRFGQVRGVSIFASISQRLLDIQQIEEAERIAARVAASLSAYIKKGSSDYHYMPPDESKAPPRRRMKLTPGAIFDDLEPGEEVGTINSSRPNNELIPFRQSQLKAMAAGAGVGYSTIARDYSGTYSSQRQSLVEAFAHYRPLTAQFVAHLVAPVYEAFIAAALDAGKLSQRDLRGIDLETLTAAEHYGPAMPAIDPTKEAKANIDLVEANLKTRQQCLSERGHVWDETLTQLESEREELEAAGLLDDDDADPAPDAPAEDKDPDAADDDAPKPYTLAA